MLQEGNSRLTNSDNNTNQTSNKNLREEGVIELKNNGNDSRPETPLTEEQMEILNKIENLTQHIENFDLFNFIDQNFQKIPNELLCKMGDETPAQSALLNNTQYMESLLQGNY